MKNLFDATATAYRIEQLAMALPPMAEVLEVIDRKELEDERAGLEIPREALVRLRPILEGIGELQKVIGQARANYAKAHAKPELKIEA